jgi:hypothetical protein
MTPEAGMLAADGRVTFNVGVVIAGLTPGTYRGHVGFTTSDGVVRSAAVTLVVSTAGGGACTPSGLAIVARAPVQNFQALTGAPVPVEVELIDEACGGTTAGASVLSASVFIRGQPCAWRSRRPCFPASIWLTWALRR